MSRVLLTIPGYVGTQSGYGGRLFHRRGTIFRACGFLGLVCAVVVTATLAIHLSLSLWLVFSIFLSALSLFFGYLLFSRFTRRAPQLVLYRYFIASIGVSLILSWLSGQPILPHLDVTVVGFGAFVACGRVGCFVVGCCHGGPSRLGICYREENITAAFPPQLLGVRLFPIQIVESLWLAFILSWGCYQIWTGYVPGEVVGWFIAAYCPARFLFELARWRTAHSLYRGLSEAQWTSIGLVASLVLLERFTVLPPSSWHWLVAIFLALVAIIVIVATEVKRFRGQVNNRAHRIDIPPCSGM
jgi:hypothetical protein